MDAGIGETMLIGAAMGGGMSALRGGNVAQGALMGGALGGLGGGIASLAGGAGALGGAGAYLGDTANALNVADQTAVGLGYSSAAEAMQNGVAAESLGLPAGTSIGDLAGATGSASSGFMGAAPQVSGDMAQMNAAGQVIDPNTGMVVNPQGLGSGAVNAVQTSAPNVTDPSFMKDPLAWMKEHPIKTAAYGLGAYTLANMFGNNSMTQPKYLAPYNPVTAQQMGLARGMSSSYAPQMNAMYTAAEGGQVPSYATGGSLNVTPGSVATSGVAPSDLAQKPNTGIASLAAQYGINPVQAQQAASALGIKSMAAGGQLGSYSDGGRMLKGVGDGMSDSIPATIGGKQPARLADSEFVVPADVVSHLGNGSSDAGAKRLYKMMDQVRQARTGRKKQAPQIKADKYIPK